jgi:hypothetical protein
VYSRREFRNHTPNGAPDFSAAFTFIDIKYSLPMSVAIDKLPTLLRKFFE